MRKLELGGSGIWVSELCLGSMTWGSQNTQTEAHAQIDQALERGVNFIDTAEMYPTNPVRGDTVGRTESIIGAWLGYTGRRDQIVLASKISGGGRPEIRDGLPITPDQIRIAVEASLGRLQTDYIDLYQLHWPNRGGYQFRRNWAFDPRKQAPKAEIEDNMAACLDTLGDLVNEGKIREFGLSNESAWGMAQWLRLAGGGLPRAVTIQNEYSLMCRLYDTDLAELGVQEDVTLLAYSPLAAGMISGKYSGGAIPEGSRMSITADLGGRVNPRAFAIADYYGRIAQNAGIDVVTMAIAWIMQRPFPVIPIVGATSGDQLAKSLDAAGLVLPPDVVNAIERAHQALPMPF